ncbi:MAG: hypothetical protein V7725_03520 [Porticoccus sp.]
MNRLTTRPVVGHCQRQLEGSTGAFRGGGAVTFDRGCIEVFDCEDEAGLLAEPLFTTPLLEGDLLEDAEGREETLGIRLVSNVNR